MKFSAQEEYGLRCLLVLARSGVALTIPEISRREGMSQTHVAKLLMVLRKEGFVRASRGQVGGYVLARPAGEIEIRFVLARLGGSLYDGDFCTRYGGANDLCTHAVDCSVRSLWQKMQYAVDSVLSGLTLADLIGTPDAVATNVTFHHSVPSKETAQ
ncbi:MAG: transcriptional regulator [Armatimonadota bacterium]